MKNWFNTQQMTTELRDIGKSIFKMLFKHQMDFKGGRAQVGEGGGLHTPIEFWWGCVAGLMKSYPLPD